MSKKLTYFFLGLVFFAGAGIAAWSLSPLGDAPQIETGIKKPVTDDRDYKVITLDNGIKAVLISDPDTDKSAAVMNVAVGAYQDPEDRNGLAHFLEHMLFLGTEKYPEAGEYDAFIGEHGGTQNAYTTGTNTVYFFDIDPNHLQPALDRFAQFFIAPLFNQDLVDRERNAVHSEFMSRILSDGRIIGEATQQLYASGHPAITFTTGNLDTLGIKGLQEDLLTFYDQYYSADRMTLSIYGKESTEELAELAKATFATVPNKQLGPVEPLPKLYDDSDLPMLLEVKPRKEMRLLTLSFAMPSQLPVVDTKPGSYVSWLMGHEGQGSLLQVLKTKGWVSSLSSGAHGISRNPTTFDINIELTQEGYQNVDNIVALVFDKVDQIKSQGISESIYQQIGRLNDLEFMYQEPADASREAMTATRLVQYFEEDDLLYGSYRFSLFDANAISDFLDGINPDRLAMRIVAPEVKTNKTTKYYSSKYRLSKIPETTIALWKDSSIDSSLALPGNNPFIPADLALLPQEKELSELYRHNPDQVYKDSSVTIWHQQDAEFNQPKTDIIFNLESDWFNGSSKHKAATELYLRLVNDSLNDITYDAYMAGLSYQARLSDRGIYGRVSGYSDSVEKLLDVVINEMVSLDISQERFEHYQTELVRKYKNQTEDRPTSQLFRTLYELVRSPLYTYKSMVPAFERMKLEDIEQVQKQMRASGHITTLVHGNVHSDTAVTLGKRIAKNFEARTTDMPKNKVMKLDKATALYNQYINHRDSAIVLYYQGEQANYRERALYALLAQVMESPFYTALRTQKQLGYIVNASNMPMYQLPGLTMTIQSPTTDPALLQRHVDKFLKDFTKVLATLDDESFIRHRDAVINKLGEKPKTISEAGNEFWQNIRVENPHFNNLQRVALEIEKVTKTGLLKFYENQILPQDARRLVIYHVGHGHKKEFEENRKLRAGDRLITSSFKYQDQRPFETF